MENWLVALCSEPLRDELYDWQQTKKLLAGHYSAKRLFGRRDLIDAVKQEWDSALKKDPTPQFKPSSEKDYLKYAVLACKLTPQKALKTDQLNIKGFVYLNGPVHFIDNDRVLLDADLSYVTDPALDGEPLHVIVEDYPRIFHSMMRVGEGLLLGASLADFGGRNHSHNTLVSVRCGNIRTTLRIPMQIAFKKGLTLQIYFSERNRIREFFHDGVVYKPNTKVPDDHRRNFEPNFF